MAGERSTAGEILGKWLASGAFPDREMAGTTGNRAFIMEVVQGSVRLFGPLEALCRHLVPRDPGPALRGFLLAGLYQLLYMDRTAPYAAVNETVAAAKGACGPSAGGLVNAVLRRVLRERQQMDQFLAHLPFEVRMSHPGILVHRWLERYGREATQRLCQWDNHPADVVLRVNRLRTATSECLAGLAQAGVVAHPHPAAADRCLVLPRGVAIRRLPGYQEGWFAVQDPATLAAVDLLAPCPGESVLDLCAAPGGKTAALAEAMHGEGRLVAVDRYADRLERLHENMARLRLDRQIRTVQADAGELSVLRQALPGPEGDRFDAVLVDVPCSNTGVLRRRPDARWRFSLRRLERLRQTQSRLLTSAAALVRPGGRMVYSTCSLEPEENDMLVRGWADAHSSFRLTRKERRLPFESETDGAYAALLRKTDAAERDVD